MLITTSLVMVLSDLYIYVVASVSDIIFLGTTSRLVGVAYRLYIRACSFTVSIYIVVGYILIGDLVGVDYTATYTYFGGWNWPGVGIWRTYMY